MSECSAPARQTKAVSSVSSAMQGTGEFSRCTARGLFHSGGTVAQQSFRRGEPNDALVSTAHIRNNVRWTIPHFPPVRCRCSRSENSVFEIDDPRDAVQSRQASADFCVPGRAWSSSGRRNERRLLLVEGESATHVTPPASTSVQRCLKNLRPVILRAKDIPAIHHSIFKLRIVPVECSKPCGQESTRSIAGDGSREISAGRSGWPIATGWCGVRRDFRCLNSINWSGSRISSRFCLMMCFGSSGRPGLAGSERVAIFRDGCKPPGAVGDIPEVLPRSTVQSWPPELFHYTRLRPISGTSKKDWKSNTSFSSLMESGIDVFS